jgi:hypothetical protein
MRPVGTPGEKHRQASLRDASEIDIVCYRYFVPTGLIPYLSFMNQSTENDLFGITLTPYGSTYLLRLYNMAKVVFILAILITMIFLTDAWMQNKIYARNYSNLDWLTFVMLNIYPIYSIVIAVITIVQIYFYFYFTRQCKRAIQQQQTDLFNASFKWLYRNTVCACIMFVLELVAHSFFLYGKYVMILKLHPN